MVQLKIKLLKQNHPNNCWAASLSMALQVFGINESEQELDKKFEGNSTGLNLDIVNAKFSQLFTNLDTDFRSEIFTGVSSELTFQEIKREIDSGNPILIGVNDFEGHSAHALLVIGYDEQNSTVLIADPWTGNSKAYKYSDMKSLNWSETLIIKKK